MVSMRLLPCTFRLGTRITKETARTDGVLGLCPTAARKHASVNPSPSKRTDSVMRADQIKDGTHFTCIRVQTTIDMTSETVMREDTPSPAGCFRSSSPLPVQHESRPSRRKKGVRRWWRVRVTHRSMDLAEDLWCSHYHRLLFGI